MLPEDQFNLLIRLDERTINIEKQLQILCDHADNGGWIRCHERESRLKTLEEDLQSRKDKERWFKRITTTSLLGLIIERVAQLF